MQNPAAPPMRAPRAGDRAAGHDVDGVVDAVAVRQPLAADGVWRVTLAGETFGRLVCPSRDGGWHLLQLDELSDEQLDRLDEATSEPSAR